MPHQIEESNCIKCGTCVQACPVDAIKSVSSAIQIMADECVDCQTCARICPTKCVDGGFDKYLELRSNNA